MKFKKTLSFIIIVFFFLAVFFFLSSPFEWMKSKRIYKKNFEGIITERYIDFGNHNSKIIKASTFRDEIFQIVTANGNNEIFEFINVRDTIFKDGNSFEMLIRNNETKYIQLNSSIRYLFLIKLKYPIDISEYLKNKKTIFHFWKDILVGNIPLNKPSDFKITSK